MSLAALNQPPLVALAGLVALGAFPRVEEATANCDLWVLKALNVGLYGLCMFAVGQPGRIDGEEQQKKLGIQKTRQEEQNNDGGDVRDYMRSLLIPSGWAFAIWGPILLGELVFVFSSAYSIEQGSALEPLFRQVSAGFLMSQVFQTLWTASFRSKYKGWLAFIPAAMLSGIALSLNNAHRHFALYSDLVTPAENIMYFLPMSLHFGWTTAATLVNLNGAIAMSKITSAPIVIATAHFSALVATGIGMFVTLTRKSPVYGCVIGWALSACATGMTDRIREESVKQNDKNKEVLVGARVQKLLCVTGALLSVATSAYVVLRQ